MQRALHVLLFILVTILFVSLNLSGLSHAQGEGDAPLWRGIRVAPEDRCSPYDRDDYPYSQDVELRIIARQDGEICSPYTGECFASRRETDIEHIIAISEAHDSGLCGAGAGVRAQFASDLRNLTLAAPALNRNQKRAKDAADWLPPQNRCWFANQIIIVRRAYALTIDRREADALDRVLEGCVAGVESTATPVRVVNAARVNARSCADTSCDVVTTFSSGQALDVLEEVEGSAWNNDTRWLRVRHGEDEVYVHGPLLSRNHPAPVSAPVRQASSSRRQSSSAPAASSGPQFSCNCSKTCAQMASCQEAYFQLNTCGCRRRDGDNDGVPCENICG